MIATFLSAADGDCYSLRLLRAGRLFAFLGFLLSVLSLVLETLLLECAEF